MAKLIKITGLGSDVIWVNPDHIVQVNVLGEEQYGKMAEEQKKLEAFMASVSGTTNDDPLASMFGDQREKAERELAFLRVAQNAKCAIETTEGRIMTVMTAEELDKLMRD